MISTMFMVVFPVKPIVFSAVAYETAGG
jgi:hypothetical protein